MTFHCVADNLRQSFRALADGKPRRSVVELPGVSIASLGVAFQMFNAAFPSDFVGTRAELEERLRAARNHFDAQSLRWAFWICEDWIALSVRRRLSRTCETWGLRLSSDMPGMATAAIRPPMQKLPDLDIRRVQSSQTLNDFRALGATCFHVPLTWFSEVFDPVVAARDAFVCWVGYHEGLPVATAATASSGDVVGVYNVATVPERRHLGYGEAITRHAIEAALRTTAATQIVLQSTSDGMRLYDRMGFRSVTRVLVYSSFP